MTNARVKRYLPRNKAGPSRIWPRFFVVRWRGERSTFLTTNSHLPGGELYLVDPYVIVGHGAVAIHLEGHVQLTYRYWLRRLVAMYKSAHTVQCDRDEMCLPGGGALKFPRKVVPLVWRHLGCARNSSRDPVQVVVPN